MKLLKKVDEVIEVLAVSKLQKQNALTSTKYNDKVTFKCGCYEQIRIG